MARLRSLRLMLAAAAVAVTVAAAALPGPAAAGPMLGGGDSRDQASAPAFTNFTRVVVRPGESGAIQFDIQNRYNVTLYGAIAELKFHVGGDWLEARPINATYPDPPTFEATPAIPQDINPGELLHVSRNFTTNAETPPGPYLVSVDLTFRYRNDTGSPVPGVVKSFGALTPNERAKVDLANYSSTVNALGIDGVAPDTGITVDGGEAGALFLLAVEFGIAVTAIMGGAGYALSRRAKARRRKAA